MEIDDKLYNRLVYLGIIDPSKTREHNVGESNYSQHLIQPWTIWLDYPNLTSWDDDILKRVLRTKNRMPQSLLSRISSKLKDVFDCRPSEEIEVLQESIKEDTIDARIEDYTKIIHICQERIRQLKLQNNEI